MKKPSRAPRTARSQTRARTSPQPATPSRAARPWLSWTLILLCVTLPAVVFLPGARDTFRLPKLLVSECLGLLTLIILAWRLRKVDQVDLRAVLRRPVVLAVLPLLAVAALGLLTSAHPLHVQRAWISLAIGAACLVGWSLGLRPDEHRRGLLALTAPAVALALVGVAQYHHLLPLFAFEDRLQERIAVTSLAGGAFDLAAFLVLPTLVAQLMLRRAELGRWRWAWGAALAVYLYAMAVTQTLTAILALLVASAVLWLAFVPWKRLVAAGAVVLVVGVGLGLTIEPLRVRLMRKVESVRTGDLNTLLTGRLDGWWAAFWMFEQRPLVGVGQGAYRAEFGDARLALTAEGRQFYRRQHQPYFTNAHNELLEVAAETGIAGCLAAAWAIWQLVTCLRRRWRSPAFPRADAALMTAGAAALAVLALATFPFRVALVAYPFLFFLSWIFAPVPASEIEAAPTSGGAAP